MAAVKRWIFRDLYDGETYTVPINPREMTGLFRQRNITINETTAIDGQSLFTEGTAKPVEWSFSGTILDDVHYEALRHWVYDKPRRIEIEDHFGRRITVILRSFEPTPKRAVGKYWRHEYTINALVISVTEPTVVGI